MQPSQINPAQREYINSTTPPKKAKSAQLSTQGHLNFAEIRDGIVIMRDGSLRMIVMCSPTNYDLNSPSEKESIEYAYQGFLNGLHFPIQISVQSRKIDLDGYLAELDQKLADQTNPLLAGLMEDYIFNIRDLLTSVNIMDKRFFVVVPYFVAELAKDNVFKQLAGTLSAPKDVVQSSAQFEARKRELSQRTASVAQGLASIGVRSAVLKTQEIIELYYGSYNVEESQQQTLSNTAEMVVPVVTREGGNPAQQLPQAREPEPQDLYASANSPQTTDPQIPQGGAV